MALKLGFVAELGMPAGTIVSFSQRLFYVHAKENKNVGIRAQNEKKKIRLRASFLLLAMLCCDMESS